MFYHLCFLLKCQPYHFLQATSISEDREPLLPRKGASSQFVIPSWHPRHAQATVELSLAGAVRKRGAVVANLVYPWQNKINEAS